MPRKTPAVKGAFIDFELREAVKEAAYLSRRTQSDLLRDGLARFVKRPQSIKRWGKVPPSGKLKQHAKMSDEEWAPVLAAAAEVDMPVSHVVRVVLANEVRRVDKTLYPR